MVNLKSTGSSFYYSKITFEDNGETKVVYTDNVSEYQNMAVQFADRIRNMVVENFEPTEEQKARLEVLNTQGNGQNVEGYGEQLNKFVEFGYLDFNCPEFMKSQIQKYRETSKAYLISKFKSILSQHKTEKEQGGCVYDNNLIKTDAESQAKITGTLIMMQSGSIPTVDFKAANGWLTLDASQFQQLALSVATHVQVCFKAESQVLAEIQKKTLDDLVVMDPDYRDPGAKDQSSNKNTTLIDLYEATYKTLLTAALKSATSTKSSKSK